MESQEINPDGEAENGENGDHGQIYFRSIIGAARYLNPGTSSLAHLRENLSVATLVIRADTLEELNRIGSSAAAELAQAP